MTSAVGWWGGGVHPWYSTPPPMGGWGTVPWGVHHPPTPPRLPAWLHPGHRQPRTEWPSGLNGLAGRAVHGNTGNTREYTGIHGNTRGYPCIREYTGIHGNTREYTGYTGTPGYPGIHGIHGNTGNTGIPGIQGIHGNTGNTGNKARRAVGLSIIKANGPTGLNSSNKARRAVGSSILRPTALRA